MCREYIRQEVHALKEQWRALKYALKRYIMVGNETQTWTFSLEMFLLMSLLAVRLIIAPKYE